MSQVSLHVWAPAEKHDKRERLLQMQRYRLINTDSTSEERRCAVCGDKYASFLLCEVASTGLCVASLQMNVSLLTRTLCVEYEGLVPVIDSLAVAAKKISLCIKCEWV